MKYSNSLYRLLAIALMSFVFLLNGCDDSSGGGSSSETDGQSADTTDDTADSGSDGDDDDGDTGDDSTDTGGNDDGDDNTGPATYTVGGQVIDLTEGQVQVRLETDGQMNLNYVLTESGSFTFEASWLEELSEGDAYSVTLLSEPDNLQCSLVNASGVVAGANVDDIELRCFPAINARAVNRNQFVELTWVNLGDYSGVDTEWCESTTMLSDGFDSCQADGGSLELNPTTTHTLDPASNNTDYWFELAVRAGDHQVTRTVTARPEDPDAPTSQSATQATGTPSQVALWNGTAVSAAGHRVLFNNGTQAGGWHYAFPTNTEVETVYFEPASEAVYFVIKPNVGLGHDNNDPRELWRTDGTDNGTWKVAGRSDFGFASPTTRFRGMAASDDQMAFVPSNGLYVVDNSAADNYRQIGGVTAHNPGLGSSFNTIPMLGVDGGILFTGYLDGEDETDARLLKLLADDTIEEVHGDHDYERLIGNLRLRQDTLTFTAAVSVADSTDDDYATTLWQVDGGEVKALFDPRTPANGGAGFRGALSPTVTQSNTVYFYTRPWDASAGEFSERWQLGYFDGDTAELIWDDALLGDGWVNDFNDSALLQYRRSAAVGDSLLFLAPASGTGNVGSGRMWVMYDPATDEFSQVSVGGELRFGRNANQVIQAEEKTDGTWFVHGYDTYPAIAYEVIHLTEDGSNTFVLGDGLSFSQISLLPTDGERLWFRNPNLYRVLAD